MFKINNLKETALLSGFIGIGYELIFGIKISYTILLILLVFDTVTGISKAVKNKKFSSRGLAKLVSKIITYSAAVLVLRLLEISIQGFYETAILSQMMIAFLNIIEVVSILENLTAIGVPIPTSLIKLLVKQLKIPGLYDAIQEGKAIEEDVIEIDEIIKYKIPIFLDENIRELLEIKFKELKNVLLRINSEIKETDTNNELLYWKVISSIEFGFKEIDVKWKDARIPNEVIENFNKCHQPRVDAWLLKIKSICFAEEPLPRKKEHLNEVFKIILYQTLLDTQKLLKNI